MALCTQHTVTRLPGEFLPSNTNKLIPNMVGGDGDIFTKSKNPGWLRSAQASSSSTARYMAQMDEEGESSNILLDDTDLELLKKIRAMRVKEIKAELDQMRISSADAFEKEELVQRLWQARMQAKLRTDSTRSIDVPLKFSNTDGTVSRQATPGQLVTMKASVKGPSSSLPIHLLLDTGCRGLILTEPLARQLGLSISPTSDGRGVAYVDELILGNIATYGSVPATVDPNFQALPFFQGIMGWQFLSQFACVELDFREGVLRLYEGKGGTKEPHGVQKVGETNLSMTPQGEWMADVWIDGRGPVTMLVDTGAQRSILNWKAVQDGIALESGTNRAISMVGEGLSIAICDIPVLESLRHLGVGGILGCDVMLTCSVVRMNLGDSNGKLTLFQ
eukprot:scaffold28271_cov60-Attheya_sp.AAC.2